MDPIKNPFSPGAGSPPPELVGREGILEQARVLLGRVKEKRPEKSILLTGLRGVGKTVLLNEIERMAVKAAYRTVSLEAHEDKSLAALLVPPLRKLLAAADLDLRGTTGLPGDLVVEVDGQRVDDVDGLRRVMEEVAAAKKPVLVMKVLRGIHTAYLEFEPNWKN